MDKFIGKRLDGKYEIHNLIGVGGMACVYRAYDRVEDRWVAIKILKEEFSDNSDFLRRFRNEAKAITLLSHPNIVEVHDVSFGDRLQYIVMEYIDGITLKQYIEQEGVIRWDEALHFTIQILMALEHAHEKGIIHRDIKPQNVMLLQNGTIKVTDFGIARFSQSETQTMTDKAIGSVHYIAPEQARGDYITDKADIYSVGVMLYEMITGRLPFVADNAVSVALMQLQAKPTMPRELNPICPEAWNRLPCGLWRKTRWTASSRRGRCWMISTASAGIPAWYFIMICSRFVLRPLTKPPEILTPTIPPGSSPAITTAMSMRRSMSGPTGGRRALWWSRGLLRQ